MRIFSILAAFALAGCNTAPMAGGPSDTFGKHADVKIIEKQSFQICPSRQGQAGVMRFDSSAWQAHLTSMVPPQKSLQAWRLKSGAGEVIRYAIGEKPSLGYSVSLTGDVSVKDRTLMVVVKANKPKPGAITGSAMTSPCVYFQVLGASYDRIAMVDAQTGEILR